MPSNIECKTIGEVNVGKAAATAETLGACSEDGCTKGVCIASMLLQQFLPWCPCDEHGIDLQHCIACSCVVMPPQSMAYTGRAAASATIKIALRKRIFPSTRLDPSRLRVNRPFRMANSD